MPLIKHSKVNGECWSTTEMESVSMLGKVRMNEYGKNVQGF